MTNRNPITTQRFAGEKVEVFRYGPDYEVELNGHHFGVYLSPAAGVNAAQQHIMRELENS